MVFALFCRKPALRGQLLQKRYFLSDTRCTCRHRFCQEVVNGVNISEQFFLDMLFTLYIASSSASSKFIPPAYNSANAGRTVAYSPERTLGDHSIVEAIFFHFHTVLFQSFQTFINFQKLVSTIHHTQI